MYVCTGVVEVIGFNPVQALIFLKKNFNYLRSFTWRGLEETRELQSGIKYGTRHVQISKLCVQKNNTSVLGSKIACVLFCSTIQEI